MSAPSGSKRISHASGRYLADLLGEAARARWRAAVRLAISRLHGDDCCSGS